MAKKHSNRPGLYARHILDLIAKGKLPAKQLKGTLIFYITEGHTVRQTWLSRDKNDIVRKKTSSTYLGKGIFLAPIWKPVPAWEIKYRNLPEIHLRDQGIRKFRDKYFRLVFCQVDGLQKARRQQDHAMEKYLDESTLAINDMVSLFEELARRTNILEVIQVRQAKLEFYATVIRLEVASFRRSVASMLNSPVFSGIFRRQDLFTLTNNLQKISKRMRQIPARPFGRRLRRAAFSLERTVANIKRGRLDLARKNIQSAIKNIPSIPKGKEDPEPA